MRQLPVHGSGLTRRRSFAAARPNPAAAPITQSSRLTAGGGGILEGV